MARKQKEPLIDSIEAIDNNKIEIFDVIIGEFDTEISENQFQSSYCTGSGMGGTHIHPHDSGKNQLYGYRGLSCLYWDSEYYSAQLGLKNRQNTE